MQVFYDGLGEGGVLELAVLGEHGHIGVVVVIVELGLDRHAVEGALILDEVFVVLIAPLFVYILFVKIVLVSWNKRSLKLLFV